MKQGKLFLSVIGIAMLLLPFATATTASALNISFDGSAIVYTTEGLLEKQISSNDYQFIKSLKVIGEITGYDMNVFANLCHLEKLDLSETDAKVIQGCKDLKLLTEVILPSTVEKVEISAFEGCSSLRSINLSNVLDISDYSFSFCEALTAVNLASVKRIGQYAFQHCYSLTSIDINPEIEEMDVYVFMYCPIEDFNVYSKVLLFGEYTLAHSEIKRLHIHSNQNYGQRDKAFWNMNGLTDVYIYDAIPGYPETPSMPTVTLHIPGFNISAYKADDRTYRQFGKIVPLGENLKTLKVYRDLNISSNEDLGDKFDLTLLNDYNRDGYPSGSLVNNAPEPLILGDFVQHYRLNSEWNGYYHIYKPSTTFINNGTVTADNVKVVMDMYDGWNFISFPFDVNISDIVTPKEAVWVIREYKGDIRANRTETGDNSQTESAWVNVTDTELKAGKGYIFRFLSTNGNEFTFSAVDNENKNNIFSNRDVTIPLNYYSSKYPHNASWNLIGNPFDVCFDSKQIETEAPIITVWRSGTYEAFSLVEDEYVLTPFEAFFVQATGENTSLKFLKEGRYHTYEAASAKGNAPRKVAALNPTRAIINLHISGNGFSDRTRLVINEEATTDYEIGRDASKFLSPDANVPQIYMIQSSQNLAINERPMDTGMFRLGSSFGVEGKYTISCDTKNSDYSVILYDAETGVETDITDSNYEFIANAGTDNNRFSVRLKVGESGINDVKADNFNMTFNAGTLSVTADGEINIYTIDGKLVASGNNNLEITLSKGIYVVKAAGKTKKVTY